MGWGNNRGWKQGGWKQGWQQPQPVNPMAMMMMMMKGKGKGKGKGGSWGGGWKSKNTVSKNYTVDKDARHTGKILKYNKWSGFGFVACPKGIVPGDKLFVHWRNIQTDDRFPSLVADMEVEFGVMKHKDSKTGEYSLRAKTVTLPGGANVCIQDDLDAQKKTFIGGQHVRYTGKLKFYSAKRGFGWIIMDQRYEGIPAEIRVEEAEVNAGGKKPLGMKDIQVEYGIWKTKKDEYKAYNMSLPKNKPMTQEALEGRAVSGSATYNGTVQLYNWRKGWGFVTLPANANLPKNIKDKMTEMKTATEAKGKKTTIEGNALYFRSADIRKGTQVKKEAAVQFQIYTDEKGAGACDIH